MKATEVLTSTFLTAARLVLTSTAPIQALVDQLGLVHYLCNQQAIRILNNDGFVHEAKVIAQYLEQINAGTAWADEGWKNMAHYHDPCTRLGCKGWLSAGEQCARYYELAGYAADQQDMDQAFFYLGAAVHLVQDLCVPHHSRNVVFSGHHHYEKWAEEHVEDYLVDNGGIYSDYHQNAADWVQVNAMSSYDLISLVSNKSHNGYKQATRLMIPQAEKTSAGFFKFFLEYIKIV